MTYRYYSVWTPGNGPSIAQFKELHEHGLDAVHEYADYGCGYEFVVRMMPDEEAAGMATLTHVLGICCVTPTTAEKTNSWKESYESLFARKHFKYPPGDINKTI